MPDKQIICKSCQQPFVFTEGEQEFYASQTPPFSEPKRCKPCRDRIKAEKAGGQAQGAPRGKPVPDAVVDEYRDQFNRRSRRR